MKFKKILCFLVLQNQKTKMKYFTFFTLLYFTISHNLVAQSVDINESSVIQNYLIELDNNTLLKGKIEKVTPDSIFMKLEFIGNFVVSRKSNFIIEIKGGSTFRGELLDVSNDSLKFSMSEVTDIWIENSNIAKLTVTDWQEIGTEGFSLANQNKTRYFFSPSAFHLEEGSGYYQNIGIFFNAVNVGIGDNTSIGFGTEVLSVLDTGLPTLYITPKVSKQIDDNTHLAGGLLLGFLGGAFFDESVIGIAYGTLTKGTENKNVSFVLGHSLSNNKNLTTAIGTINAYLRINEKYGFVTENWLTKDTPILSYGLRKFNKRVSTDFGLILFREKYTRSVGAYYDYDNGNYTYVPGVPTEKTRVVGGPYIGWTFNW